MKILDVVTESREIEILDEALGTLSQLNAGPLINVIKQSGYTSGRGARATPVISKDQPKFQKPDIGSESPIVDAGKIKSIADIRKAYKKVEYPAGFALYIGTTTVALGIYDSWDISGSSRSGEIAWDFTKFHNEFDSVMEKMNAGKTSYAATRVNVKPTSIQDKEEQSYNYDPRPGKSSFTTKQVKYTGDTKTTAGAAQLIEIAAAVAAEAGQPLMAKLILTDMEARKKRSSRQQLRYELSKTGDDIKTRLAKYKLSKKPTANNIKEFVDAVMAKKLSAIQFAGNAYSLSSNSNAVAVQDLLHGKPFNASYRTVLPGDYSTIDVTYVYTDNGIIPIFAKYKDKNSGAYVDDIINPMAYAVKGLGIKNPKDKDTVVKRLLQLLKDGKLKQVQSELKMFRDIGNDWPELNVIEKSLNAEIAKKQKSNA